MLFVIFITTFGCRETAGTFQELLRERQSVKRIEEKRDFSFVLSDIVLGRTGKN